MSTEHPQFVLEYLRDQKDLLEFHDVIIRNEIGPTGDCWLEARFRKFTGDHTIKLGCQLDSERCDREINGEGDW